MILRNTAVSLLLSALVAQIPTSISQENARGEVVQFTGNAGELILSRDGVVYELSVGSTLQVGDIIRSSKASMAVVEFDGCEFELPEMQDVYLTEEYCDAAPASSMAALAAEDALAVDAGFLVGSANAPLVVGGVTLAGGGILAASGNGDGGVGVSSASAGPTAAANTTATTP